MVCGLFACATTAGLLGFEDPTLKTNAKSACESASAMLTRWGSITGVLKARPNHLATQQLFRDGRVKLITPAALAVTSTDVFIVDTGLKTIFKYDRALQVVSVFASVPEMGSLVDITIDRGLSLYLVDHYSALTTQFDIDGRVLRTFSNESELANPVAVTVDDHQGEIFIADKIRAHILVFNRQGGVNNVINALKDGINIARNIEDIIFAGNQLYVVDELGHQIHALSPTGNYRYSFGAQEMIAPDAITVDEFNRVFVSSSNSNTIKVYQGGQFIVELGGPDSEMKSEFILISDIWVEDGLFYVADSATASIKIYRVSEPCVEQ